MIGVAESPTATPQQPPKAQHVVPYALFMVVVTEDQSVLAQCLPDRFQQSRIGPLTVVDRGSNNSGSPLAVGQVTQAHLRELEEIRNEIRDGGLPALGMADVRPVGRKGDVDLVAKLQEVNRKAVQISYP